MFVWQLRISATAAYAFLYFTFTLITIVEATDEGVVYTYCPHSNPNSNYTSYSTYQTNLDLLLSWLSSNSSTRKNGYHKTTAGSGDSTVYGAFLCRGDLDTDACQDCVSTAEQRLIKKCPVEKSSLIWLSDCLVRFSDQSFFSVFSREGSVAYMWNPQDKASSNVTGLDEKLLGDTMNAAAEEAANGGADKKFGTKEAEVSSFRTLYTLAQCTPNLSQVECLRCLKSTIEWLPSCCGGKQAARVLYSSCEIRYQLKPFYSDRHTISVPTPQPHPVPLPPTPVIKEKSQISTVILITIAAVALVVLVPLVTFSTFCIIFTRARRKKHSLLPEETDVQFSKVVFLQFDFDTIMEATNNFSDDNKLGEGGFGAVYKGTLHNGQDIAVKRLSRTSRQGADEFKNEVVLVAKLQHRNLVRLLGFCLDGEEKMLIYEFVLNKSLDHFLFDSYQQPRLNWSSRYKIIEGIVRGMLYLHEDSRFKIIHRDLKASNVLLDENLNPKIADFGTARLFGANQIQGSTSKIVGTLGYMSPEYLNHGHISVKMDVYSFGVLVLEIISGKKITSFYDSDNAGDLLNYAWKNWRDGTPLELLEMTLRDSCTRASAEVIRCIHIGLSCVQQDPAQRPTMQRIVLMLNSHSATIATPKRPAGYIQSNTQPSFPTRELDNSDKHTSQLVSASTNEASNSDVSPR